MTGGWKCDIIVVSRKKDWRENRDERMVRCKNFLFFSTKINSIYILYGGFIQTVFAPFGQMINGLIK